MHNTLARVGLTLLLTLMPMMVGCSEAPCPRGQTSCGGTCRDLAIDRASCGACGNACGEGNVCDGASCRLTCQPGRIVCGGVCTDPATDRAHCGATADCAGANAGESCPSGEVCDEGLCQPTCAPWNVLCSGTCADPLTSRIFCGATGDCTGASAGEICGHGEVCNGTECVSDCSPGMIVCGGGTCIDPLRNRTFCGATDDCLGVNAGEICDPGEICTDGTCQLSCQQGLLACGGVCTDPLTSRSHCGATGDCMDANAGETCVEGEICNGMGDCAASCSPGLTACGDVCVDLAHDPDHCHDCERACTHEANELAYCAPEGCRVACLAGHDDCDDGIAGCETATFSDEQNCGGCGVTCSPGEECAAGNCVDHVTMFSSVATGDQFVFDGDLVEAAVSAGGSPANGREAADHLCSVTRPVGLSCNVVRAFLSTSATDEIRDMSQNYGVPVTVPVVGPTGIELESSFPALLDGSLASGLYASGVYPGTSSRGLHWTGSHSDGRIETGRSSCDGFTNNDKPEMSLAAHTFAMMGASGATDATWLERPSAVWCGNPAVLLCLCY